jgi:hypothetical protein
MPTVVPYQQDRSFPSGSSQGVKVASLSALGALVLAPYVIPALGLDSGFVAGQTFDAFHSAQAGAGLAGWLSQNLAALPAIGTTIADGGWGTALSAAGVGIGGLLVGNSVIRHSDSEKGMSWGHWIHRISLVTSMLISLPALLTAVSLSLTFLSSWALGPHAGNAVMDITWPTLGAIPMQHDAASGAGALAGTLSHMLACTIPAIPAGMAMAGFGQHRNTPSAAEAVPPALQIDARSARQDRMVPSSMHAHHARY